MRKALIDAATGMVENIIVLDSEAAYDPGPDKTILDPTGAEIGGTWDGSQFLPPPEPDPTVIELQKELEAARLLSRAADKTFLDGHWITLRAMSAAGITVSVTALADAVATNDRPAFDRFFRNQVKARLA